MHLPPVDRLPHWRAQAGEVLPVGAAPGVSTGAAGPERQLQALHPLESMERLGHGAVPKTPDVPSAPDAPNRDWTEPKQEVQKEPKPPEPPQEPISKQLLEFLQSMWRASGSVIDVAQDMEKTTLAAERLAQQASNGPLTYSDYSDPKVRRSGGV